MIVATLPDGARFYSNDAQLFSDGETTIYSPRFLPTDTVLTSTTLHVAMTVAGVGTTLRVTDADSGYVLYDRDRLTVDEAFELASKAIDEYAAVAQ